MDQLPNIFQANLARLYSRVIGPANEALPVHPHLASGEASSPDEFLNRCAAQVDNYTANEAAKAFTLITMGLFERQLRIWSTKLFPTTPPKELENAKFLNLMVQTTGHVGTIIEPRILETLEEAFLVANVVRHGNGGSSRRLQTLAPHLWKEDHSEYVDLLSIPSPESEQIRLSADDVRRYVQATLQFWGRVNPVPFALRDPVI